MWQQRLQSSAGGGAERPGQIPPRGWLAVVLRVVRRIGRERLWIESAGVAFFGLLSLFPALVAAVSAYGLVADARMVGVHLALVRDLLPAEAYGVLEQRVTTLIDQPSGSLGFGLLVSLALVVWGASRGMNTLILVCGHAYREPDGRGFLLRSLVSFAFTFGAVGLFLTSVLALAGLPILLDILLLDEGTQLLFTLLRWPLLGSAVFLGLFFLYRFAPHRRPARWRWLFPGALFATLGWMAFSYGFSLYIELAPNFGEEFGSLSSVVVLMLWLYYSVMVVLVGALLNAELEYQTGCDTTAGPARPAGSRGAYVADHVVAPEA